MGAGVSLGAVVLVQSHCSLRHESSPDLSTKAVVLVGTAGATSQASPNFLVLSQW